MLFIYFTFRYLELLAMRNSEAFISIKLVRKCHEFKAFLTVSFKNIKKGKTAHPNDGG